MNIAKDLLLGLGIAKTTDQNLIFDFFVRFSVFEYQLIEKGFRNPGDRAWTSEPGEWQRIEVNWGTFTNKVESERPDQARRICEKYLDFMRNDPPSLLVQNINTKRVTWGYTAAEATNINHAAAGFEVLGPYNMDRLGILLRRVRNNLFHGGKFRDPAEITVQRVQAGLNILADFEDAARDLRCYP